MNGISKEIQDLFNSIITGTNPVQDAVVEVTQEVVDTPVEETPVVSEPVINNLLTDKEKCILKAKEIFKQAGEYVETLNKLPNGGTMEIETDSTIVMVYRTDEKQFLSSNINKKNLYSSTNNWYNGCADIARYILSREISNLFNTYNEEHPDTNNNNVFDTSF